MEGSQKIKTFLRARPINNAHPGYSYPSTTQCTVPVPHNNEREERIDHQGNRSVYQFSFDRVFAPDATQVEVFQGAGKNAVLSALAGINSTVFTYGMTGLGKTYTMLGAADAYEKRGLIPRCLSFLYEQMSKDESQQYIVSITYVQIYNENAYDLFADPSSFGDDDTEKVQLGEAMDGEVFLKNCAERTVSSEKDALGLLFWGNNNRIVCETACNLESSRSHCILTVNIEAREPGAEAVRRSKLHLVDLAGSESVKKTNAQGLLLREACNINLSLHYLEQVIVALQKHEDHVPFRNSIMTSLLRDSLGGNCDTSMIATINPHPSHGPEAVSTCRFAQRVAMISNCARVNESVDPDVLIRKLKRELAQKERELEFYRGQDKANSQTGPLSESEREYCREKVDVFLGEEDSAADTALPLNDLREVMGFFHQLREYVRDYRQMGGCALSANPVANHGGGTDGGDDATQLRVELEAQQSQIEYLNGMLGQKTRKNHPLRLNDRGDKGNRDQERGGPRVRKQRGAKYSATHEDMLSVYATSQCSTSPRSHPQVHRSPGRRRRRTTGSPGRSTNRSPDRSSSGRSVANSCVSVEPRGYKGPTRGWITAFSSREAEDVWKDKSVDKGTLSIEVAKEGNSPVPPPSLRKRRGLPRACLLPYLGRDSSKVMLPARRSSAGDNIEPVLSGRDNLYDENVNKDEQDDGNTNLPIEEANKET